MYIYMIYIYIYMIYIYIYIYIYTHRTGYQVELIPLLRSRIDELSFLWPVTVCNSYLLPSLDVASGRPIVVQLEKFFVGAHSVNRHSVDQPLHPIISTILEVRMCCQILPKWSWNVTTTGKRLLVSLIHFQYDDSLFPYAYVSIESDGELVKTVSAFDESPRHETDEAFALLDRGVDGRQDALAWSDVSPVKAYPVAEQFEKLENPSGVFVVAFLVRQECVEGHQLADAFVAVERMKVVCGVKRNSEAVHQKGLWWRR